MIIKTLAAIAATIIFTSFAIVVAVGIVIDALRYIAEISNDEVGEVPVECNQEFLPDDFDTLYIIVADGDRRDSKYWLKSVKGCADHDK